MSPHDYAAEIADIEAIKQVKYRYLRAMDTKHWDDFADTMTEDVVGSYGSSLGKELHFNSRTDLVEYLSSAMGPGVVTEHRVTHPEITVTGDTASGIWYLQDRVIVPEYDFMLIGAAFYRDTYRRTGDRDRWRRRFWHDFGRASMVLGNCATTHCDRGDSRLRARAEKDGAREFAPSRRLDLSLTS